jgi:hypothetical protein
MASNGLTLHCGAAEVSREEVVGVITPEPSKTHYPVPHSLILEQVEKQMVVDGITIADEAHSLTAGGNRYFGILELDGGDGQSLVVGIRNSHDKAFSAGVCLGNRVWLCDNRSWSAEVALSRMHTRRIREDMPRLVATAIGKLGDARRTQEERFAAYQETGLCDSEVNDILIDSLDAKVLGATKLPKVLEEWRAPSFPDFKERNLWSLFNGFTHILKGVRPEECLRRTCTLNGVLDSYAGFEATKVDPEFATKL